MHRFLFLLLFPIILFSCRVGANEKPLNLLFFGNSFTAGSGGREAVAMNGVPGLVKEMAIAAGKKAPNVQKSVSGGKTLEWHVANNTRTIRQPNQLAKLEGEVIWDYVVMQEQSLRPTDPQGDEYKFGQPDLFIQYAFDLYEKVKDHSPKAKVILYETWARHPTKPGFYPQPFKDPSDFQAQLRKNYTAAAENINKKAGSLVAIMAPAGDAWEALGFPLELYAGDRYHAGNQGSLLNALVIYQVIYGGKVSCLNLSHLGTQLKIEEADLQKLKKAADSVLK
jgi:hypothetical protein